jgi:signal transduction histidine kinase
LIEVASSAEVSGQRRLFLFTPDSGTVAFGLDGRTVEVPSLAATLSRGGGTVRLSRAEAAAVGLPSRTALAGIAAVETGDLGRWGVAVVSSAASERDRDIRASWRLALSVLFAGGIVLAFGAFALRRQREQLVVEQELALAQLDRDRSERLVRASRAATMGTFAMGIAHEISTPLGVISGRTEQLLSRTDDPRSRRGLTAIGERVEQIGGVVRSFLDLARGGAPTIATVDPRVLVEGSVRLVEFRFASSGVHLAIDLPPGVPPIHCDLRLVEHALVNLLLNACEACEMGGHVELAVRAAAGTIAFVVTDDGKGISPEEAARATEPFFTTKAHGDGAGLGLAIVQEIAKSHRGSLSIGPRASKGTRAALQLPIEQDHG